MRREHAGEMLAIYVDCVAQTRLMLDPSLTRHHGGADRGGAQLAGAVLVDIRPQVSREAEGALPGAVVIERTVLEWRLDPASDSRLPFTAYDLHVVIVCNEGFSSSLAAATLQDLGLHRATHLDGGYRAWRAAGLPTA